MGFRGRPRKEELGVCPLLISSACLPHTEPERSLKPYSLVQPLLVPALRPVVLLPECLAPRLIRNLLDLPNSRLDFQVCPAGESLSWETGGWSGVLGQPGPLALHSCFSLPSRKPIWGGTVHTLSAWSPQGPVCHPWTGQQDPSHPGVCWEGRCWGGGRPSGSKSPTGVQACAVPLRSDSGQVPCFLWVPFPH